MDATKTDEQQSQTSTSAPMSIANSATLASTTSKISFGVKKKKEIVNNSICLPSFEKKATDNDDDLEEQDAKKIQATHFDGSRLKPCVSLHFS